MRGMSLPRARARYLSAMGLVLPSLALSACTKDPPAQVATTEGGTTTPATATVTASAELAPTASATATPPPVDAGPATPPTFRMPSCPSGAFCLAENPKLDAKQAAPAPFGKCALTATHPDDGPDSGLRGLRRSVNFSEANTKTERAKTPTACCYTWVIPCPGGRAFRDATGTAAVARTIDRNDWTAALGALATAELAPEVRAALADHWTREAAFEHASIASFAQLTLDLLAVGAPPELLASTQRAALDEIEHAQIAFALATAYGGGPPIGPAALAALPGACRSLAEVARTTFLDACVGESVASAVLAESSRQAVDPVLREALAKMADDEDRHAELAWRIVAWAMRSGDPEVARALASAQAEVIDELTSLTSGNELRATVLREVVIPCSMSLLSAMDGHSMESASSRRRQMELG
jgi:hypothetical protein